MSDELAFSWRGREDVDSETAQVVGAHLMRLASRLGRPFDAITTDDVVEDASSPESPLHKYFQWDDKMAAIEHRRSQARMLLGSIRYRVEPSEPRRIGFVNVRVEGVGRAYVPYSLAQHNDNLRRQARESALAGIKAWQHRYADLSDSAAYDLMGQAAAALEAELSDVPQVQDAAA